MLIRRAELESGAICDIRIEGERITEIGTLAPLPQEQTIDARGGLLLPGLHDHHIHLAALAASLSSVWSGPPAVTNAELLAEALRVPGAGWIRGIGYHESVAGMLNVDTLDRLVPDRPVRIQHRSGRMWFLNSAALSELLARQSPPPGLEHDGTRFTGRLFDADAWLQQALGSEPPSFAEVGARLAAVGVTGVTEISPGNDARMAAHFARETLSGALPQRVLLAGKLELSEADASTNVQLGPAKLHLHDAQLPALADAVSFIARAHERGRVVAIHCATQAELLFALAALEEAGVCRGDRIEHASVAPDFAVARMAELELAVVTQPHFIFERGDRYLADVEIHAQPLLYRLRAFLDANVTLAGGSDAPFGGFDPWHSMAAAVSRATANGQTIAPSEALTPEEALDLYLRLPHRLDERRHVTVGAIADLCLLDCSWQRARTDLSSRHVRATFIGGRLLFDRIDQPPP
jgi:predicted amidohydrolase YtcJ